MTTLFSIGVLVAVAMLGSFFWVIVGNLAGLPGALVAGRPADRPPWRFWLGTMIAFFGQAYVGLAFAAGVAGWTRLAAARPDVVEIAVWPFAFLSIAIPFMGTLAIARSEVSESQGSLGPQVIALGLTTPVVIVGFILFSFVPEIAATCWPWVPLVSDAADVR